MPAVFKVTADGLRPDTDPHDPDELSTLVVSTPLTVREGADQDYTVLVGFHHNGTTYVVDDTFTSADDAVAFEFVAAGFLEVVEPGP